MHVIGTDGMRLRSYWSHNIEKGDQRKMSNLPTRVNLKSCFSESVYSQIWSCIQMMIPFSSFQMLSLSTNTIFDCMQAQKLFRCQLYSCLSWECIASLWCFLQYKLQFIFIRTVICNLKSNDRIFTLGY